MSKYKMIYNPNWEGELEVNENDQYCNYLIVPRWIRRYGLRLLTPEEWVVMATIADCVPLVRKRVPKQPEEMRYVNYEQLRKETGFGSGRLERIIKNLVKKGLLDVTVGRPRISNRYSIRKFYKAVRELAEEDGYFSEKASRG